MRKRFCGELTLKGCRRLCAVAVEVEQPLIVANIDDHADAVVVLGGRSEHRRSADVDVLDGLGIGAFGVGDRLLERVEVDDEQIDEPDAVSGQCSVVRADTREQPAVDGRMQRLYATVHDLWETRDLRNLGHVESRLPQQLGGSARRDELEGVRCELLGERDQSLLVGNAEQRPTSGRSGCAHRRISL